jgi:hypothetical protein
MDVCEHPARIPAASNASDAAHIWRVFKFNVLSVYQAWSEQIWDQTRLAPYVPVEAHHADELAVPPGSAFGFGCAGRRL